MSDFMTSEELQAARERAEEFCSLHLVQCCRELAEWGKTSVLCDGKVRELAQLFSYAGHSALSLAEAEVKRQAVMQMCRSSAASVRYDATFCALLAQYGIATSIKGTNQPEYERLVEHLDSRRTHGLSRRQKELLHAAAETLEDLGASLNANDLRAIAGDLN